MELESLAPRHALPVGLLALLPITWYALGSSLPAGVVAATNVLLITTSLYVAFTPVPDDRDHGRSGASS